MPRRPPPTFGDAPVVESPSARVRQEKTLADLAGEYARMDADRRRIELDRRRVELAEAEAARKPQPKSVGTQLREQSVLDAGKALTGEAVKARAKLPTLADQAEAAFAAGRELVEHPGFEATVGMPNPFKGGFGSLGTFPGSRARDFTSRLDNVKSQAFMQAFESLKGAGAITEAENKAATQALANLDSSVSEEQFKKNLQLYLDLIKRGYDRTQKTANIQPVPYSRDMLLAEKKRRDALRVDVNPVPPSERR